MEKKRKITQYRERLDKTLASPELTNEETLKTLVKNQLLHSSEDEIGGCSDNVVDRKTVEVSNFLDMLRSASVSDNEASKSSEAGHGEWKLKQDTEEFRVMYHEGPQGSPFHSLLVEGYVDGPIDTCLCISWESPLYRKWWPQYSFPPFKITTSKCLQKVRIGEQISLVRVKVTWPLSAREAVVHYFLFEYFQDDLIVCLVNTISDLKSIDKSTHGFTNEGIPEAKDVVRIDLVGGFALQKVTPERSYFRTIANMDMKLDFVPPSLINFISRQLIGNGFKLYQKAVASVSNCDKDFNKALEDPLYTRIREALNSTNQSKEALTAEELKNDAHILPEEQFIKEAQDGLEKMEQKVHSVDHVSESLPNNAQLTDRNVNIEIEEESEENTYLEVDKDIDQSIEIEEEESEESTPLENNERGIDQSLTNKLPEKCHMKRERNVSISPGVEQALETLEKAIYMVREYGFNRESRVSLGPANAKPSNSTPIKDSTCSEDEVCSNVEVSKKDLVDKSCHQSTNTVGVQDIRSVGSNSFSRELNHNSIAPASPVQGLSNFDETNKVDLTSSQNKTREIPVLDQTMPDNRHTSTKANGIHENTVNGGKKSSQQRKHRFCCFPIK